MFTKKAVFFSLLAAILLITAGIFLQAQSVQASAGTPVVSEPSTCLSCHENRYYQHDTGNHYCLTEAAARCVDCHAGDPEAFEEKAAHAGLVIHPILNGDISRCESCHVQDAQAHVDTFANLAGYSPSVHVAKQVEPSVPVQVVEEAAPLAMDWKVASGISVIFTVVVALFVLCILTQKSCH